MFSGFIVALFIIFFKSSDYISIFSLKYAYLDCAFYTNLVTVQDGVNSYNGNKIALQEANKKGHSGVNTAIKAALLQNGLFSDIHLCTLPDPSPWAREFI